MFGLPPLACRHGVDDGGTGIHDSACDDLSHTHLSDTFVVLVVALLKIPLARGGGGAVRRVDGRMSGQRRSGRRSTQWGARGLG